MALRTRTLPILALALGAAAVSIPACAPGTGAGSSGETDGMNGSQVTGALPVGTALIATANVNLRSGPSTSDTILDVLQDGDCVTVVTASPQGGFYNVNDGGEVGWSSGQYYKLGPAGG